MSACSQDAPWRLCLLLLLCAGLLCFGAGIMLPMMTVKKLMLMRNTFTVLGGIGELLADKTFGLGLLLLFFSVFFPLTKFLLMMAYVWRYPQSRGLLVHWHHWLTKAAKFSMLDVFVVAQLLMIVKLGWIVEVEIHSGIYWFTAAVMISLAAGMLIDQNIAKRSDHVD